MLLLFFACALLPIGILALISFRSVTRELEEQGQLRLRQIAKSQVMSIVERLELLDAELQLIAQKLAATSPGEAVRALDLSQSTGRGRFLELSLRSGPDPGGRLDGAAARSDTPAPTGPVRLDPDDSTLVMKEGGPARARAFLYLPVGSKTLWAEVQPDFLWWGPQHENNLPPASEICILDAERTSTIFCPEPSDELTGLLAESKTALGELEWHRDGTNYLASYRSANLEARFGFPGLTVVLSEEKNYLLRPLADFKRFFPVVIVSSLGIVLLLSIGQIRKQMVPLERLQAGTQRVAAGDFSIRVQIASRDEFEQLANSFNSMADKLGKQFGTLHSMNEIVQGVLSALDRTEIVRSILTNFDRLLQCETLSVALLQRGSSTSARIYQRGGSETQGNGTGGVPTELTEGDLALLSANPKLLLLDSGPSMPTFLQGSTVRSTGSVAVLPVFVEARLAAVIAAAFSQEAIPDREDLERARQLADQVAVAFSNSELLLQLEDLSQGALTALARSIDAKSHWTAGHSERVARMAVMLGREMGLESRDLDILHRGSLLHDLGKIGIASEILDKPGRLTEAEMEIVRGHVAIGARILEPIAQLSDLLPLVLQHHEWFDGKGYPNRLAGEQIEPLARILAVVDIYDALRSPRPYREALDHEPVMNMITIAAGAQLDPQVVGAFVRSEAWQARDRDLAR